MKAIKILFLGISSILLSCTGGEWTGSGDDILNEWSQDFLDRIVVIDSSDNKKYFNPPEWILGTWYHENHYGKGGIHFSETDVILFYDRIPASYNSILNTIVNGEKKYSLYEEVATDSTYFFSIIKNFDPNYIDNHLFQKISNDSINEITSGSESNYTATFIR